MRANKILGYLPCLWRRPDTQFIEKASPNFEGAKVFPLAIVEFAGNQILNVPDCRFQILCHRTIA